MSCSWTRFIHQVKETVAENGDNWEESLSASPALLLLPRSLLFTVVKDRASWSLGLTCCGLISRAGRKQWGWPGHAFWWLRGDLCTLRLPSLALGQPWGAAGLKVYHIKQPALLGRCTAQPWRGLEGQVLQQPFQVGFGLSFHCQSFNVADIMPFITKLHPVTPNLNVSPQKSSPLLIRVTGLAANLRCKRLIEGTPDTHILANSWRGSMLRC